MAFYVSLRLTFKDQIKEFTRSFKEMIGLEGVL